MSEAITKQHREAAKEIKDLFLCLNSDKTTDTLSKILSTHFPAPTETMTQEVREAVVKACKVAEMILKHQGSPETYKYLTTLVNSVEQSYQQLGAAKESLRLADELARLADNIQSPIFTMTQAKLYLTSRQQGKK